MKQQHTNHVEEKGLEDENSLNVLKTKTWSKHTPPSLEMWYKDFSVENKRLREEEWKQRNGQKRGGVKHHPSSKTRIEIRPRNKSNCNTAIESARDTLGQEASMTIFLHRTIFYFIAICFRKIQYVPARLLTFFPKMVKALGNVSKILSTHCIFEYCTSVILWLMNFNNSIANQFAKHYPQH